MKIKVKYKPKLFLSLNITFKVLPSLPSFFLHIFFFFKHRLYPLSLLCQIPSSLLNLMILASVSTVPMKLS